MLDDPHATMQADVQKGPAPARTIVLVLQGGGALGSYQAGAYQALCNFRYEPTWLAGISIGAINCAIIAGNPPEHRTARLREFWELATAPVLGRPLLSDGRGRTLFNQMSALMAASFGVPGFFMPRIPPAPMWPSGMLQALSFYDTRPLHETLERLVDFDRLNNGDVRLSVGAVNVKSGNFAYFDNARQKIGPLHIMASAALPPGFPPVEIDGEFYWDGGIVSNTPLDYVLDQNGKHDLTVFQIDLFSARGPMPTTILESAEREKDIRYSSRTRMNTDKGRALRNTRKAMRELISRLPPEMKDDPLVEGLMDMSHDPSVEIAHLIYRHKNYETNAKDYDFSRFGMLEHWASGDADVRQTLEHPLWRERRQEPGTFVTYDLTDKGLDRGIVSTT